MLSLFADGVGFLEDISINIFEPEPSFASFAWTYLMLMLRCTERVVSQHLDHPTVADAATCTLLQHALQLGLEGDEPGYPRLHLGELRPGDAIGGVAGLIGSIREAQ